MNKDTLKDKLDALLLKHKQISIDLEQKTILIHKVEGAIEAIQMLLRELETEDNTNKE
jgi:hypothetical protein